MRIQHPRATDAFDRGPPSRVAVPAGDGTYRTRSVDNGYVDGGDDPDAAMDGFERAYGVEYDRETGEIIGADPADDPDGGGDEPPDADTDDVAETEDEQDSDDLEAWANWNEEDWLSLGYKARKADVEDGLVDDHLEEIIEIETSSNVREAAEARLEELED